MCIVTENQLKFYIMDTATLSTFSIESVIEYQKYGHKARQEIDIECMVVNYLWGKLFL